MYAENLQEKIRMRKMENLETWKTKRSINAVSAWLVYMYDHQYEYAPPPSTVPTTPNPIHTRNMHPNNCSRT